MNNDGLNWIELLGYQHEVAHTRVLQHLLSNGDSADDPTRLCVARLIAGEDVVGVDWTLIERTMTDRRPRRVVDLVAGLRLDDGSATRLGVETKVDSAWTRDQLAQSVQDPDRACLLAVGMTGLAVTEDDLKSLPSGAAPWTLVDAVRWDAMLDGLPDEEPGDVWAQYRKAVSDEADWQQRARAAVTRGEDVTWGRQPELLGQWAFFGAVLEGMTSSGEWERKKLISGPLVTLLSRSRGIALG